MTDKTGSERAGQLAVKGHTAESHTAERIRWRSFRLQATGWSHEEREGQNSDPKDRSRE